MLTRALTFAGSAALRALRGHITYNTQKVRVYAVKAWPASKHAEMHCRNVCAHLCLLRRLARLAWPHHVRLAGCAEESVQLLQRFRPQAHAGRVEPALAAVAANVLAGWVCGGLRAGWAQCSRLWYGVA